MRALLLVAVVFAGGCYDYGSVDPSKVVASPPGAEEAEAAIFPLFQAQGMTTMPKLFYYGGAALDCPGGVNFNWDGSCVQGVTVAEDKIILSDCGPIGPGMLIHQMCSDDPGDSTLPHENAHALYLRNGGGGCADHNCTAFKPGGVVEQASNLLISLGM